MYHYSKDIGPHTRYFNGSDKVLPANVMKMDNGERTYSQDGIVSSEVLRVLLPLEDYSDTK